jgi:hypothetical protein
MYRSGVCIHNTKQSEKEISDLTNSKTLTSILIDNNSDFANIPERYESITEFIDANDILLFLNRYTEPWLIENSIKSRKHIYISNIYNYGLNDIKRLYKLSFESDVVMSSSNQWEFTPAGIWIKKNIQEIRYTEFRLGLNNNFTNERLKQTVFNSVNYLMEISNSSYLRHSYDIVTDGKGDPFIINAMVCMKNGAAANIFIKLKADKESARLNIHCDNNLYNINFSDNSIHNCSENSTIVPEKSAQSVYDLITGKITEQIQNHTAAYYIKQEISMLITNEIIDRLR